MRALAAALFSLALAACAGLTPVNAEVGYGVGKLVLQIGAPDGSVREVEIEAPTSVRELFMCLTLERDPVRPFDNCECYRKAGVSIPEAAACDAPPRIAEAARGAAPRESGGAHFPERSGGDAVAMIDPADVPAAFFDAWREFRDAHPSRRPRLAYCERYALKGADWLRCLIDWE